MLAESAHCQSFHCALPRKYECNGSVPAKPKPVRWRTIVPPTSTDWVPWAPVAVRVHPPPIWPVDRSTHWNGPEPMKVWLTIGSEAEPLNKAVFRVQALLPLTVHGVTLSTAQ